MSSGPLKKLYSKTSVRLTIWYSSIFVISTLLLFVLTWFLLSKSILDSNRQVAQSKIQEYTRLEKESGLVALLNRLKKEHQANQRAGFYIRVSDAANQTLLETVPLDWKDIETRQLEKTRVAGGPKWLHFRMEHAGGAIEMNTLLLSKDIYLQVGFGQEERVRLLKHFQKTFLLIVIPMVLLGVIGGFFLGHRSLRPVRDLIAGIRSIDSGKLDQRVPFSGTGDELDQLVQLFNGMLAKIETLVRGMREALSNVAHDLRTPVTRLRVGIETILQSESDADSLREALLDCAEESERIVTVLNTLMDISEAETGTMSLNLEEVNLTGLLLEIQELYQYVAEDRRIRVAIEAPETLLARVDKNRIRQVMANLLDNALKYSPEGKSIEIKARRQGDRVVMEFADQGLGIDPVDLPRIFERLYRGDKSRSHRGLGLGLSLVQAVVNAHQGSIEVESAPDQGAVFTLILPVNPGE